jgi:pimeloyl-ACP methyl ester carboxylesterase
MLSSIYGFLYISRSVLAEEVAMEAIIRSLSIHYQEVGTGVPLIMLHGQPLDHRHMMADMEPLFQNRSGWRRIYLDLPGMGRTPAADWITQQDHMLTIVSEFIEMIAPKQRYVVAGISYGGYLARGLIHHHGAQIDGAFLLVPRVEYDPAKQNLPVHQILHEDPQFLAALTPAEDSLRDFFVVQSIEALESFRAVIPPAAAIANHAFLERLQTHDTFSFTVDVLPTPFPAPTVILTGRQDAVCGYREAWTLLDQYPRATYVVLDGAGHGLGLEQKPLFHALAQEWLDRVEAYRAQTRR